MRKFRFITKEEYLANKPSYQIFHSRMENLFGNEINMTKINLSEVEFLYNFDNNVEERFRYKDNFERNWTISMSSIVEITKSKKEINMERIRKEDWDLCSPSVSVIGVEMQSGDKFYLHPNFDGFVPVNLKKHEDYGYSDTDNLEIGFDNVSGLKGNKKVFKFDSMQEMVAWATS